MNKRRMSALWSLLFVLLVLLGCGRSVPAPSEQMSDASLLTKEERVEGMLAQMTPTEKIGQMMIIGVHGTEMNDDIRFMLSEYVPGGVILFDRNLETADGVRRFTKGLQEARHGELPLFIAIDEEGGIVSRMEDILPPPPAQSEIGKSSDPALARQWAKKTAKALEGFGFNLNFAPVADVGEGERCYSADAEETAAFVLEAVAGYEEAGMLCTLKHFPGLGKGEADTHLGSVIVEADMDTLEGEDLVPFRALVENNDADRFFVMVSHITYTSLDEVHPASLSPAIMTSLLREEFGWRGVIVTDDFEMGAADIYPFEELGVRAVEAGADIVLVCHDYGHEQEVFNGLLRAVQSGRLPEARVDDSVRRILRAKLTLDEIKKPSP